MRSRLSFAVMAGGLLSALLMVAPSNAAAPAAAAPAASESLLLILDASGSMLRSDGAGGTRIESARAAVTTLIDRLPPTLDVGLRVYGHRVPSSDKAAACQDTELVVPVAPLDAEVLKAQVAGIQALGETPIGLSLQQAVTDFPTETPGTIVLVSDGADECFPDLGPEPCQVARDLVADGVDLRVEVVGLQVEPVGRDQLQCMADATGGSFSNLDDIGQLGEALVQAQQRARRSFTTRGEAVAGGPSLIDATLLPAGTYSDSILAQDVLWYAVDVTAGQEVTARMTVATTGVPAEASATLTWNDENATRVEDETLLTPGSGQAVTVAVSTGEVNGARTRFGATKDPGTYYLSVATQGFPPDVEHPFVLEILLAEAEGAAGETPAATAGTSAGGEPTAAVAPVALPPPPGGGGGGGGGSNVVLVVVLLLLAAAGAYLYLRRRRTSAAREEPPGYS